VLLKKKALMSLFSSRRRPFLRASSSPSFKRKIFPNAAAEIVTIKKRTNAIFRSAF